MAARVAVVGATALTSLPLAAPAFADALDEIARCESGGNIRATNPASTASGKYQFLDSTWRGLGGVGRAKDASEVAQDAMARKLLAQAGTAPWNASRSCWSKRTAPVQAGAVQARTPTGAQEPRPAPRAPRKAVQRALSGVVTVERGDTLSRIATEHGQAWRALWQANRSTIINPNMIFPGQVLKLAPK